MNKRIRSAGPNAATLSRSAVWIVGEALAVLWCAKLAAQPSDAAVPPITAADREAAFPDLSGMDMAGMMIEDPFNRFVLLDQLEVQDATGGDVVSWDVKAWAGRNLSKLWVRSEGERHSGTTESAELQLLWGRSFARWWDFVAGVREDFQPSPDQTWAAVGIQGLAPYRFDLEATAFVGEGGQAAARFEAEYELLITNRLILEPLVELNWFAQDDVRRAVGSGLASAEAGFRLRYEIRREVAPYIGLVHEKKFGRTADFARAGGADTNDTRLVAGIRLWF
jgi:copper resistance protein B